MPRGTASKPLSEAWLAITTSASTVARLEHDLHEARAPLDGALLVCTHVIDRKGPRLAATVRLGRISLGAIQRFESECLERNWSFVFAPATMTLEVGPREGRSWARAAIELVQARREGRAIRFRGQDELTGERSVKEILDRSEIDRVETVASGTLESGTVETRDYLRPVYVDGSLVLYVTPLGAGRFRPSESATTYRCCAAA